MLRMVALLSATAVLISGTVLADTSSTYDYRHTHFPQQTQKIQKTYYKHTHHQERENQEASRYNMGEPQNGSRDKGYSYFPTYRDTRGQAEFIFDPNYDAWAAYNANGQRVNVGKASGGKDYCPDIHHRCHTVVGTFRVIAKEGPGCISRKFPLKTHGGSPMPWCMYFHPKGYAVHGSYEVPDNGNASHGCIRITPAAAQWLNQNFMRIGTKVIVLPYR